MMERRDVRQFDRCCVGLRKIKKLAMSQSKGRRLQWELAMERAREHPHTITALGLLAAHHVDELSRPVHPVFQLHLPAFA